MSDIVSKYKQLLPITLLITASASCFSFPRGCEVSGFGFQQGHLILNDSNKQTLFLLQNIGQNQVQLEHVETRTDVFMSPKLESKININQWSAFSSDISNFYFKCTIVDTDNSTKQVKCEDYISICQYPRAQFPLSNKGNYWISTNKEISVVIQEAVKKGIYLKW
jgi:hypothetical protein